MILFYKVNLQWTSVFLSILCELDGWGLKDEATNGNYTVIK